MESYTQPKKFGEPLRDWDKACNGRESRPFVAKEVCEKCDYHSGSVGEHLGVTSRHYYCNLHGKGGASIAETLLKINLLKYDISYWSRFLDMECSHKLPFNDCPYILEHTVAAAVGKEYGDKSKEIEKEIEYERRQKLWRDSQEIQGK